MIISWSALEYILFMMFNRTLFCLDSIYLISDHIYVLHESPLFSYLKSITLILDNSRKYQNSNKNKSNKTKRIVK